MRGGGTCIWQSRAARRIMAKRGPRLARVGFRCCGREYLKAPEAETSPTRVAAFEDCQSRRDSDPTPTPPRMGHCFEIKAPRSERRARESPREIRGEFQGRRHHREWKPQLNLVALFTLY